MELADFYGLDFNLKKFEVNILLDMLGIRRKIEATNQVKSIISRFGMHSSYTQLAKRQQALNYFKPLIEQPMLAYDSLYYIKEVNTATDHDRRYNAEERLLDLALIIASAMTPRERVNTGFKPTLEVLRGIAHTDRFDRLWDVLTRESQNIIAAFKQEKS